MSFNASGESAMEISKAADGLRHLHGLNGRLIGPERLRVSSRHRAIRRPAQFYRRESVRSWNNGVDVIIPARVRW
jgi:hypothetical protein